VVEGFAVGDLAGVGCLVDSCRTCASCVEGLEQYCEAGNVQTYGGLEKETGRMTHGGYSSAIVVDQDFVLHISGDVDLAATAPLLCAGITTYSPLRHWNVGPDSKVGVVGLGGLGHMAVKLAAAMGAEVTLFTTSPGKADDGRALGADHVVISKDADQMAGAANSLDLIIDSVAAPHDLEAYLATQFVSIINALKAVPDPLGTGGQTLFDNTLLVWARDMGDAQNHNQQSMRFVLASGTGGYLKTASGGRYVASTERHERILLNACEAMGVTEYTGFGDPMLPTKQPLPGISA